MTGTGTPSRTDKESEGRWKGRGRSLWALFTAGGVAATFFSWFGIEPGTAALWGAALSAAALVVVLGGMYFLGTDDDAGLPLLMGFVPFTIGVAVITLLAAAAAGIGTFSLLDRWRDRRGDAGLEVPRRP